MILKTSRHDYDFSFQVTTVVFRQVEEDVLAKETFLYHEALLAGKCIVSTKCKNILKFY